MKREKMIRRFVRRILCRIDFWLYIVKGKPLTKIRYYKGDVPSKYWGRNLLRDDEVAPYFLVFCQDPKKIVITEKTREWAEQIFKEMNQTKTRGD